MNVPLTNKWKVLAALFPGRLNEIKMGDVCTRHGWGTRWKVYFTCSLILSWKQKALFYPQWLICLPSHGLKTKRSKIFRGKWVHKLSAAICIVDVFCHTENDVWEADHVLEGASRHGDNLFEGRRITIIQIQPNPPKPLQPENSSNDSTRSNRTCSMWEFKCNKSRTLSHVLKCAAFKFQSSWLLWEPWSAEYEWVVSFQFSYSKWKTKEERYNFKYRLSCNLSKRKN